MISRLLNFIAADLAEETVAGQANWIRRFTGVFGLLLIAVTWRLWTPQRVFPQIPLLRAAGELPSVFDWVGLLVMIACLLSMVIQPRNHNRWTAVGFALALLSMVLIDQHRLQPWAYHLMLVFLMLSCSRPRNGIELARLLTISIYLFSAISKLDYQFVHTLGQQFLGALTNSWSGDWPVPVKSFAALGFPLSELAIAIGLVLPSWRKWSARGGVVLHIALLGILGPLGLGHHGGVLVWNVYFIVLLSVLYRPFGWQHNEDGGTSPGDIGASSDAGPLRCAPAEVARIDRWSRAVRSIGLVIVMSPLLEPWALIDHWPAWQLYAPRNSRVSLEVFRNASDRLPPELQPFLDPVAAHAMLVKLDLDRWSLETLAVPIYPQDRFQLGVALAVAERSRLAGSLLVTQRSISNRWNGKRVETKLRSVQQVREHVERFRLNAFPRGE